MVTNISLGDDISFHIIHMCIKAVEKIIMEAMITFL